MNLKISKSNDHLQRFIVNEKMVTVSTYRSEHINEQCRTPKPNVGGRYDWMTFFDLVFSSEFKWIHN